MSTYEIMLISAGVVGGGIIAYGVFKLISKIKGRKRPLIVEVLPGVSLSGRKATPKRAKRRDAKHEQIDAGGMPPGADWKNVIGHTKYRLRNKRRGGKSSEWPELISDNEDYKIRDSSDSSSDDSVQI